MEEETLKVEASDNVQRDERKWTERSVEDQQSVSEAGFTSEVTQDMNSRDLTKTVELGEVMKTEKSSEDVVGDMEYRTDVKTADDSMDSESDSSDESDDSSDANTNQDAEKTINNTITSVRDCSPERKVKLNRHGFEDVRTKGELMPEELPPLEELTITVDESVEMVEVGSVDSVVGVLVVVKSGDNVPPLNDDTILFVDGHKVLGQVFEVFGPVKSPYYSVRFNDAGNIETKGIKPGTKVYCAPKEESFTKFVFVESLKKYKGSDASWEDNNEPPDKYIEYSDDEEEQRAKAKRKNKNKQSRNGEEDGGDVQQKKNKKNMQSWPPRDDPSPRNNSHQGQVRGGNPFNRHSNQRFRENQPNNFGHRPFRPRMENAQANYRPWAQSNSRSPRGPQPQFGGPPNFHNQQRFDNQIREPFYGNDNHTGVFGGNQRPPYSNGNQFVHQSQEPVRMNFCVPPPGMNFPPQQNNQQQFQGPPPRLDMRGQPPVESSIRGPSPGPSMPVDRQPIGSNMRGPPPRCNVGGSQTGPNNEAYSRGPVPRQDMRDQPLGPNISGPPNMSNNVGCPPVWQNMEGPNVNMNIVNHNTRQGDNPSQHNNMEQPRPNQFRVHELNPRMPFNNGSTGQTQHPATGKYEQVNLSGNDVGPYRQNIQNTNSHVNSNRQYRNTETLQGQNSGSMRDTMGGNANSVQTFENPNQMTRIGNGNQGFNANMMHGQNQGDFQGQNTGSGQGNQALNINRSQFHPGQVQTQSINNQTGQVQNFGGMQTGPNNTQIISNSLNGPTNQEYQRHPQTMVNNCPNMIQNMTPGPAMFRAPFTNGGQGNINFMNTRVQNPQNPNIRPSQIIDPRLIQRN